MDEWIQVFNNSLQTGYIDKSVLSHQEYQPELLLNQKQPPKKVLSSVLRELEYCDQFFISVAFVTTGGVATIINALKDLEGRGVKGRVLVSQYLNFTEPEALKRLLQFKNIELRISTTGNLHAKGYVFSSKGHYNLIIGSSNLTAPALATNNEWNLKISALSASCIVYKVLDAFESDFGKAELVSFDFINKYEKLYAEERQSRVRGAMRGLSGLHQEITPNSMQIEALGSLSRMRESGKKKTLIISATGTGKTYLSAFDAKAYNPKRLLFVVHRLTIAKDAMNTFRNVFGGHRTMGLYSGAAQDLNCDFVFSTVQTISKSEHLEKFSSKHFDYIIIDETHRSGANSYLRLLQHFEPEFLLGMTATPERSDGNDIFKLFDYNVAYEIRLNRAMEEGMLSEFHYYGVADLSIGNVQVDDKSDFRYLVATERANRIIEKANFYGCDSGIIRGLIFCSRREEAVELSKVLNLKGLKTVALTGDDSEDDRARAIEMLESEDLRLKLDYIITVDIFNEGIDIPAVNQIIMLRPTESAIIFVQQLGRGLRKISSKSYLTVIDFIGNYEKNYLIPIALYGDTSFNKDSLRRLMTEGSRLIPGASTINFDRITKERIFQAIDSANMQLLADLKKDYLALKFRLGRSPMMMDFVEQGSRDPFLFVEYSRSYYNFVHKVDEFDNAILSIDCIKLLELLSAEINNAKRVEESLILKVLIEAGELPVEHLDKLVMDRYGYSISEQTIVSCLRNINLEFVGKSSKVAIKEKDIFRFHPDFYDRLKDPVFKMYLMDSINYSIVVFEKKFDVNNYRNGLIIYNKYSRKDVCRLLNWKKDISSTIYGYRTTDGVTPCFVTYHKSDSIGSSIDYNDHFIDQSTFAWESRSNRRLDSDEIQAVIDSRRILLFVKKEDGEGSDFYFLGDVSIVPGSIKQGEMSSSKLPVVRFQFRLQQPVLSSLFQYLTQLKNPIRLYDFRSVIGTFEKIKEEKSFTFIEGPSSTTSDDYFAFRMAGESMNPTIPNGAICLFRYFTGGSISGKIVLVEDGAIQDPDFKSAFSVRSYARDISIGHNSYAASYPEMVIAADSAPTFKVIGEFVKILSN